MDISFTELVLGNRHMVTLIGMPNRLSPMLSSRIESASVVKYQSCRHFDKI